MELGDGNFDADLWHVQDVAIGQSGRDPWIVTAQPRMNHEARASG